MASSRPVDEPHPSRLAPDHPRRAEILAAHAAAMAAGDLGYLDPVSGLFVLTAAHHLERGSCCDQGCRHCPYLA
jgi:hypothetical protein